MYENRTVNMEDSLWKVCFKFDLGFIGTIYLTYQTTLQMKLLVLNPNTITTFVTQLKVSCNVFAVQIFLSSKTQA